MWHAFICRVYSRAGKVGSGIEDLDSTFKLIEWLIHLKCRINYRI